MSAALENDIKLKESQLQAEREKPEMARDEGLIASLQQSIKLSTEQLKEEEKAEKDMREHSRTPISQEMKDEITVAAALKSASLFLKTAEVRQMRSVSQALSGNGQIIDEDGNKHNITSKDIDQMHANAHEIVNNDHNQAAHKQRQEAAKLLKEQLERTDLSPEEREKKAKAHETIVEAIGEFKGAEAKVQRQEVLQELRQGKPALQKVDQVLTTEQEHARKKELFRLEQELEKGKISPEEYLQAVEKTTNATLSNERRNLTIRAQVGETLGLSGNAGDVTDEQRKIAQVTSKALNSGIGASLRSAGMQGGQEAKGAQATAGMPAQQQSASKGAER